ncbi:hypothetical protein F5884DRAFT_853250 [Xylogone sp. PMI_703]|nr:hypothetical protein F5884DRAFT_853250 [Xylogone sp. PMI_703]
MSYRVETASSARAVCRSSECSKNGVKIGKGELRLGTWVPFQDRGSWAWRHWGCVTGKQLQNIRKFLEGEDKIGSGEYRWDFLDGYEGEEKNSLDKYPELQEKVRRCITQGFIDPEDFNGDPAMNKLGEVGLKSKDTKQKERDIKHANKAIPKLEEKLSELESEREAIMQEGGNATRKLKSLDTRIEKIKKELEELGEKSEMVLTSPAKKHVRPQEDSQEESDGKASKKRKLSRQEREDEDEPTKPAPKTARKKAVKKEEVSEPTEATGTKKRGSRAKKTTKVEDEDEDTEEAANNIPEVKPTIKREGKNKAKKEEPDEDERDSKIKVKEEELDEDEEQVPPIKGSKSSRKKAIKSEAAQPDVKEEESTEVKAKVEAGEDDAIIPGIRNEDLDREYKKLYKAKEFTGDFDEFVEQKKAGKLPEVSQAEQKKTSKGRGR